jgi:hypothetical protein
MSGKKMRLVLAAAAVAATASIGLAVSAAASGSNDQGRGLHANLIGFGEVPSLNSTGQGEFTATETPTQITFKLTFTGLSGPPTVAHVHVGQRGVSGGVSFFFCGGGGKPACPASTSGSVTGTVTGADVVGPTAQGFNAGDLASVERAIDAGVTYANMHTAKFPAGEIRGQVISNESDS